MSQNVQKCSRQNETEPDSMSGGTGICASPSGWTSSDLPKKLEALLVFSRRQAASNRVLREVRQ